MKRYLDRCRPLLGSPHAWALATLLILPGSALGSPLTVFDCNGNMRATKEVAPSEPTDVSVDVTSAAGGSVDGTRFTLTNRQTGEVRSATASGGTVLFEEVFEGEWLLGSEDTNLLFSTITLEDSIPPGIAYGGAAGGAAAGAAIIGAAITEIDNRNSSSEPPSPSPTALPTPIPTKDPLCPDCNPDDEAPPIDDFFDDRIAPAATPAAGAPGNAASKRPQTSQNLPSQRQRAQGDDCFISNDVDPISPFK